MSIDINFRLHSPIANTEQQTQVKLLQNSALVNKVFIQNAQCPNSNTVNCETEGSIHPQVCDWNKADHIKFHFKGTGLQSFVTTQFNIPAHHTTKTLMNIYSKGFFYLSASVALFKHKPKDKIICKGYCSKADFPLLFSLIPVPYSVQWYNASHHNFIILFTFIDIPISKTPTFRKAVNSIITYLYQYPLFCLSCIMSLM